MTRVLDCPYCSTTVIGESLDLIDHIREDHPEAGVDEGSPRDILYAEALEERFHADE